MFSNRLFVRHQIRILLRFAMQTSNLRGNVDAREIKVIPVIEHIASVYMNLMKFGVDVFIEDPPLMKEWYEFTANFPKQVSDVLT